MKNIIKRILSEEVDKKTQTLLNYVQKDGLIKGSKLVGDIWYWSDVFNISAYGDDSIELNVEGRLHNYQLDYSDGNIVDIGIDEVEDILDGWGNNDVFTDYIQDKLYDDAMTYIWNLPALCDQDNDFISVGIKIK